ncbi:hypothetical protein MKW92_013387 [Papaver armeniacum]|nr:hypothetical protein MKW92_013387 [Papaver armeniacum]
MAQSLINPEQLNAHTAGKVEKQAEDKSPRQIQRCIGRFFFENGIDFSAANSPTFEKMMHALVGRGSMLSKVPSCNDLKGWILQEELKASQEHVREVCALMGKYWMQYFVGRVDRWERRHLINFVVDSPGVPYL